MAYVARLMNAANDERAELISAALEEGIEGMVFASNPEMWQSLYGKKEKDDEFPADDEVEWVQPGTPEFAALLRDAAAAGHLQLEP